MQNKPHLEMATTALYILLAATAVSAVQIPLPDGYIYTKEFHGPEDFVNLGPVAPYRPPHTPYNQNLPNQRPIKGLQSYDLDIAPPPLPYVGDKSLPTEDTEDESEDESNDEYLTKAEDNQHHNFAKRGGNEYGEELHNVRGEKESKGYKSQDHHAKEAKRYFKKGYHYGYNNKAKGDKRDYSDEAVAQGKYHKSGESYKGGDHGHKKHNSKGEEVTGYHKVFHKDEIKKDHDFYDVADKSGHSNKHDFQEVHGVSEAKGHNEGRQQESADHKDDFRNVEFEVKSEIDDSDNDHSAEEGNDSHYQIESEYSKKGGRSRKQNYLFELSDEDDDDHE